MKKPVLVMDPRLGPEHVSGRVWGMLRDEGYLYLEGPSVDSLPLAEIKEASQAFFDQPLDYKMRYYIGNSPIHRGYVPTGEEGDPDCTPDLKEGFDTGLQNLGRPIVSTLDSADQEPWPDISSFESAVAHYLTASEGVARTFASALSLALRLEYDLNSRARRPPNQLRLLRYPSSPSKTTQGVGTHTDFECFTIMQVTGPGFVVQRPTGDWIDIAPRPDSAVVIVGDLIEIITNGALRATPHRVGWVERERFSFPYFYCLDSEETVAPHRNFVSGGMRHYPPTRVGNHVTERTALVFEYLRKAQL